jgi:hypothetical protein
MILTEFQKYKDLNVYTDKGNSILDILSFSITIAYIKTINEWVAYIYAWDIKKINIHVVAMIGDKNKEKSRKFALKYIKDIKSKFLNQEKLKV